MLDLGCGPGDIPIRFLRSYPDARVTAVMPVAPCSIWRLEAVAGAGVAERISLHCERFQSLVLSEQADALVSNSLLHHVPNPLQFWFRLKQLAKPGACILVMDLCGLTHRRMPRHWSSNMRPMKIPCSNGISIIRCWRRSPKMKWRRNLRK